MPKETNQTERITVTASMFHTCIDNWLLLSPLLKSKDKVRYQIAMKDTCPGEAPRDTMVPSPSCTHRKVGVLRKAHA